MPSVQARRNKDGEVTSYRLTVSFGLDKNGKQIRRTKLWIPPMNMNSKQAEREAQAEAYKFEERCKQGYNLDNRLTFAEFAEYALDLKERTGVKPTTLDRYLEMMPLINENIGFLKLTNIRPQHLNEFYRKLSMETFKKNTERAIARKQFNRRLEEMALSRAAMGRLAGVGAMTVSAAANGEPIMVPTAKKLAEAMEMELKSLFWVQQNQVPLSNKTVLEYHRLISSILALADKEMLIPYNPAAKTTPPKAKRQRVEYYQPDEMETIIAALDNVPIRWKAITYLLIDTGCRRAEIMGLKWDNLDMDEGIVMIDCALLYTKSKGIYEGDTKTGEVRAMRIAPETIAVLQQWRERYLDLKEDNGDRWVDTPYVFVRDNGSAMHPDSITRWLHDFGLKIGFPNLHPHAFRHTAASTMIANGVDLVTTAAELGHANATTTAMIYAHQIARARAGAANIRGGVFASRRR